jgi:hypothetical protein
MQRKAAEKREKEQKTKAVQADDLLVFRQFSKKGMADGVEDVSDVFVGGRDGADVLLSMSRMCLRPLGRVRPRKTLLHRSAEWSNLPVRRIATGVTGVLNYYWPRFLRSCLC